MVDVCNRKCRTEGCGKKPSFGVAGTKTVEYCTQHAPEGMVDVKSRKCRTEGCGKIPSFGGAGTKAAEYGAQHAPHGMIDFCSKKCRAEDYGKQPSFGVAGSKTVEYCALHAPEGMVDIMAKKCRTEGCGKIPSFGVAGKKTAGYCARDAPDGMVDVKNRKCRTEGCGKRPSFGVAGTKTAEYCAQHARVQCGVEGFREREVGPHHSEKEAISKVVPSGAEHIAVHPPATKTSQPSGVCWSSRKRVRHPETASTASKRAVARESTAGAVTMRGHTYSKSTMPDIDEQKYPVNRSSSMKTEVLLSL